MSDHSTSLIAAWHDARMNGRDTTDIEATMRILKVPVPALSGWAAWRDAVEAKWNLLAKQDPPRFPPGEPVTEEEYDRWQFGD